MTPFMGVRISWLIVARNSDLRRDASIAWSRASASSAAERSRSATRPSMAAICSMRSRECSSGGYSSPTASTTQTTSSECRIGIATTEWVSSPPASRRSESAPSRNAWSAWSWSGST